MFENAIAEALNWTRPVLSIGRYLDQTDVVPSAATLFVVNDEGWALTCKHVLQEILAADDIKQRREAYLVARKALGAKPSKNAIGKLKKQLGYDKEPIYELLHQIPGLVDNFTGLQYHVHPQYDVALLRPLGFTQLHVTAFPIFSALGSIAPQGAMLCRVGFPFPEFTHHNYDPATDTIGWTPGQAATTPVFPLEGMVTRHLMDQTGIYGLELSTPGLRGQSGGPLVDKDGVVHGLQFATAHLDLNFDVQARVRRGAQTKTISSTPFLHVGGAIACSVLTTFMSANGVKFTSVAPAP